MSSSGRVWRASLPPKRSAQSTGQPRFSLVSNDPNGFYSRPGLAYYLTGELPEDQLFIYSRDDWRRLNVKQVKAEAVRLLPKEHKLALDHGSPLEYDRLLLATGTTAARLTVPGRGPDKCDVSRPS